MMPPPLPLRDDDATPRVLLRHAAFFAMILFSAIVLMMLRHADCHYADITSLPYAAALFTLRAIIDAADIRKMPSITIH